MTIKEYALDTSHGSIHIRESAGTGTPVILIHGNSSSGAIFRNQLNSDIGLSRRLIAIDLPGHGKSSNAIDPERSYSMEGYADAITETIRLLNIEKAVVFGWSLGGHIGLELISRFPGLLGLMITGTPIVSADEVAKGFKPSEHIGLAGKQDFTPQDVEAFARSTSGEPYEPELYDIVARTDGRARRLMFEKFDSGSGQNQKQIAAEATLPIAALNGRDEPFVDLDFLAQAQFGNLWENQTFVIEQSGHAPFWDKPAEFNAFLKRFIESVTD